MYRFFLTVLLSTSTLASAQMIDLGLDFQTNAIVQVERGFDGSIWGISGSSMDRLPTLAGVYTIRSTDGGTSWDTSSITQDWWRWGVELIPISKDICWAFTLRDDVNDTLECFRTADGGASWTRIEPMDVGLARLVDVEFFTPQIGVAIGSTGRSVTSKWVVSRTTDGGKTWELSRDMQAHYNEKIAQRNDRATHRVGNTYIVGMTSGRLLITRDAGATWAFLTPPIGGAVSAVVDVKGMGVIAVRTTDDGGFTSAVSADDATWTGARMPAGVRDIRGFRLLRDGSIATIPNDVQHAPLMILKSDLSSATTLKQHSCFGVLELDDATLLTGTELVPGQGLLRVQR